jgi:hypothetical protein
MQKKESPGGSRYPYYYKGGELFGLHLGGFLKDEDGFLERLKAEEDFIVKQNMHTGIWFDLCQTRMTDRVVAEFFAAIQRLQNRMTKMAIVGVSPIDRWKLSRYSRNKITLPVKYFDDPEDAKGWLVAEN